MADDSGNSKRQRTSSPPRDDVGMNIAHLPELALTHAASYLARPSRALLAAAMAAPSESWRAYFDGAQRPVVTTAGRAVLGNDRWAELDFEEVEKGLAAKLTDDDVAAILACIDARSNLRKLKLSGCVNISGEGLQPLQASAVLEHVDLSLVGLHESPDIRPKPLLNEEVVRDVLVSIVRLEGNALKLLVLPKIWRDAESPHMVAFMREYASMLRNRNALCSKCNGPCPGGDGYPSWVHLRLGMNAFGEQLYTCEKCTMHVCPTCRSIKQCNRCDRRYCGQCISEYCYQLPCCSCIGCAKTLTKCECGHDFCKDCYKQCQQCNRSGCRKCANIALECFHYGCEKAFCSNCADAGFGGEVAECGECFQFYCHECRITELELDPCEECARMVEDEFDRHITI